MRISRPRHLLTLAAGLAAVIALSGCGSADEEDAAAAKPSATPATQQATPTGHGTRTVATPQPKALRSGERFKTLMMERPYTPAPPASGTDDYRCFLVDPGIRRTTFMTGFQFLPQNADVVHHAIFFHVEAKDVARARALDAQAPGDGYTCFGGTGLADQGRQLTGAPWLAAWAPGGGETLSAKGTGNQLERGDQVIMQVHYNLLATGGKSIGTDQSGVRLRLTDRTDLLPLRTTLLVAPVELPCPPGETGKLCDRDLAVFDVIRRFGDEAGFTVSGLQLLCNEARAPRPGNTQQCDRQARQDIRVRAVAGHMHMLGTSISVTHKPGTPQAQKLLDVPVYDFDDQGARQLRKAVDVDAGDTLRVTCSWDATLRSKLPALSTLKPRYVVWGEGTADEMCLGVVVWTAR